MLTIQYSKLLLLDWFISLENALGSTHATEKLWERRKYSRRIDFLHLQKITTVLVDVVY